MLASTLGLFVSIIAIAPALAFDNSRSDNVVTYWGQNSYGASHPSDKANWQQRLSYYCGDNNIDVFPLAFLSVFSSVGGVPSVDLSNICNVNDNSVFSGTQLPNCQFLASDIQACQAKGKIVTLSLGGATGGNTLTSDAAGRAFADQLWNLFLGGSSSTRPFGAAVLDGIDLDIEGGGSTGLAAMVTQLRSHFSGASKKYYITAAPQCPYPDAYLSPTLNAVGFDAVYVQFYNNYCGLPSYGTSNFNFADWDNWAKTTSPNKNVKVYLGAPGSQTGANSGYVSAAQLVTIAKALKATYSSFGGVMFWDASQVYNNGRLDATIKSALLGGASAPTTSSTSTTTTTKTTTSSPTTTTKPTTTTTKTTTTSTSTVGTGSCAGVAAWSATATYTGGLQAVYNGHLWTAQWWTYGDIPGGSAGVWKDNGVCSGFAAAAHTGPVAASTTPGSQGTKDVKAKPEATAEPALQTAAVRNSRFFREQAM